MNDIEELFETGYRKAVNLLYECSSSEGFLATPIKKANYNRLKRLNRVNYWFDDGEEIPEDVYHEVLL